MRRARALDSHRSERWRSAHSRRLPRSHFREPTRPLMLHSGDVLVMGGPARLRYHGVTRIQAGSAPPGTGPGRFNLTFRQY